MSSEPISVREWLAGIGLPQYADAFEEQAIDVGLLPYLADAEFEQLGVKLLGHRLRLRQAIAALAAAPAAATTPEPAAGPERRQITVMFCDLVGSTALSQVLDPEDLRVLMQRYQALCGAAVRRRDGHVAQYLGDGILVYFGWPRAHEDDAQRALLVALEILESVKTIPSAEPLRVRIGIATGPVVVGETRGGGRGEPKTAIGETPNLAARVQGLAQPDQIMVAQSTRRLVGEAFDCRDMGEHILKGIAQPVRVWRVLGEGRAEGRFEAARGSRLTPLVNRDLEMSLLMDRWGRACEGQGQAVLLVGEPGIGKSRIMAELAERAGNGSVFLRLQCSELHVNTAFYPLTAQLVRAAGFERQDGPETRLDKLEALLAQKGAVPAAYPHFAALLSLPLSRYPAMHTSAQKQKRESIGAVADTVVGASRRRPLMLLIEDLHWIDPSTLEMVDALLDAIGGAPVLLVMTSRTGLGERWGALPHLGTHVLARLSGSHSLQLAGAVAGDYELPPGVLERVVARTDGVPLFLEEVTRALLESGRLRDSGPGASASTRMESSEIPATLKDSLTARLDQLNTAKCVAQLGSVLGRQFRHDLLLAFTALPESEMNAGLAQLAHAGLLSSSGSGADAIHTFHHALIQDAAYESLLKSDRRALHARAGELLAGPFEEAVEFTPEVPARHFTVGEVWEKAVPLWLKAGKGAWLRSAAPEAIAHLRAGLALVDRINDPAERDRLELELQSALGVVYFAAVSYAAPEALEAFLRAQALCERVPDPALTAPVFGGLGTLLTMKGDMRAGHQAFLRLQAQADAASKSPLRLYAYTVLAWSHFNRGQYDACVAAAERARPLYQRSAPNGQRLGAADQKIVGDCFRGMALWSLGHADQARACTEALLEHARALGDPYSLVYTLNFAALTVPELCRDHERVIELSEEGIRLAGELGYPYLELVGTMWRACTLGQGDGAETARSALVTINQVLARLAALGVRYHLGQFLARKARLLLRVGDVEAAQLAIAEAVAHIAASGEHSADPDVYLAEAEVLLARGGEQRALAESAIRTAMDTARKQGARSWQLRAALALARLAMERGDETSARHELAPVFESFTEGHDTRDLREAAGLLRSLH